MLVNFPRTMRKDKPTANNRQLCEQSAVVKMSLPQEDEAISVIAGAALVMAASCKAAYTYTKQTPNKHSSANLICLPSEFVKNAFTSGECEQTNLHTAIGAEQTTFDILSITDIRGNATECERKHSS